MSIRLCSSTDFRKLVDDSLRGATFCSNKRRIQGQSNGGKGYEGRAGLEKAAHTESILRDAAKRHRTSLHGRVRGYGSARDIQVHLLRPTAVPLRDEISFWLGLAQLLRSS